MKCVGRTFKGDKMFYRDYKIINKWWKKQLAINVNGKEILFDSIDELKEYVNSLYK